MSNQFHIYIYASVCFAFDAFGRISMNRLCILMKTYIPVCRRVKSGDWCMLSKKGTDTLHTWFLNLTSSYTTTSTTCISRQHTYVCTYLYVRTQTVKNSDAPLQHVSLHWNSRPLNSVVGILKATSRLWWQRWWTTMKTSMTHRWRQNDGIWYVCIQNLEYVQHMR